MKQRFKLMLGDNMESLKKLPDNSIDSVVVDPPYGLGKERDMNIILKDWIEKGYSEIDGKGFMGKEWDAYVPQPIFWKEVYRCLKPGGHILAFFGTRTYDIGTMAIRLAGFEIRDQIQWIYGSGFPKSHNIGKAVDKLEGNDREVVGKNPCERKNIPDRPINDYNSLSGKEVNITKGTSPYEGWGTALKPANEPICVARKPLSEKSVAENVLKWGTGGINVDGCRVGCDTIKINGGGRKYEDGFNGGWNNISGENITNEGRFPANIILECICDDSISHDDPNCPCRLLDEQSGESKSSPNKWEGEANIFNDGENKTTGHKKGIRVDTYSDKGGASRFFYQAKVSKAERNMGLDSFEDKIIEGRDEGQDERNVAYKPRPVSQKNTHPTVKPINLMSYLCRLITPEGGIVLDPFMGSGSTGVAAQLEGFKFLGMEQDKSYFDIASARIESYEKYKKFHKGDQGLKNGNTTMASRKNNDGRYNWNKNNKDENDIF